MEKIIAFFELIYSFVAAVLTVITFPARLRAL